MQNLSFRSRLVQVVQVFPFFSTGQLQLAQILCISTSESIWYLVSPVHEQPKLILKYDTNPEWSESHYYKCPTHQKWHF